MNKILTFTTSEGDDFLEWSQVAKAISMNFAAGLKAHGYDANFEACQWPGNDAWEFLASGHGIEFVVTLCPFELNPTRWFVMLYDTRNKPLNRPDIESFVHPILESVVREWPGATALRWHADSSTLRETS